VREAVIGEHCSDDDDDDRTDLRAADAVRDSVQADAAAAASDSSQSHRTAGPRARNAGTAECNQLSVLVPLSRVCSFVIYFNQSINQSRQIDIAPYRQRIRGTQQWQRAG